jgi:catechol 2,3-dioxygenase-like lactoylglutathione lyase family enzyme
MGVLGINHIAFRTPDPVGLRAFYERLLRAEPLEGAHEPLRAGSTILVFFEGEAVAGKDEIAFDVDARGFEEGLARARDLGLDVQGPVSHTPLSRGFVVRDPDERRVELVHVDHGVFWR